MLSTTFGACARALLATILALLPLCVRADDWPQWRGPRRDGIWREDGIVESLPEKLTFRWRREIGAGYAGPAVAAGLVYVTDRVLEEGESNPDDPFDRSRSVGGKERVLCLDAETGEPVWKHEYPSKYLISYPSGPRATPTVHDGRVYTVGAMGDFFAFDAKTGEILFSKSYVRDFGTEINTWGMAAAPLVDGDRVILLAGGKDGAGVVALDRQSGREIWRAIDVSDPGYSSPVIIEAGGTRQLIVWTPWHVHSLDPETGRVHWSVPFRAKSELTVAQPVWDRDHDRLLVTSFYNGSLLLQLDPEKPGAKEVWRGKVESELKTDGLHGLLCTPIIDGDYLYGVCSYGQLRCLRLATGERVWESTAATGEGRWWNAFLIRHRDRFFIANEQGELIIAKLDSDGYHEESRAFLIEPTSKAVRRDVVWSHPAFANRAVFARNDREIVCASLAAEPSE